jgi:hypothetical protein
VCDTRIAGPAPGRPPGGHASPVAVSSPAMRRLGLALGIAAGIAGRPASATAAPPPAEAEEDPGPWGRGTVLPSLGFGASFGSTIHVLDFGLGASYFVIDGLAVGLTLSDTVLIYRPDFRRQFPGIENETPNNIVRLIPTLQYVFLRRSRFSPYVRGGVGPVFHNRGRGTVGEWTVGGGAFVSLWGPVALAIGIDFFANFPDDKWRDAFSYMGQSIRGCALFDTPCSFNLSPRIGLVFQVPTRGPKRRGRKSRQPPPPPPDNPMTTDPPWTEDEEPPVAAPLDPAEDATPEVPDAPPPDLPAPDSGDLADPNEPTPPTDPAEPTPEPSGPVDAPPLEPTEPGEPGERALGLPGADGMPESAVAGP